MAKLTFIARITDEDGKVIEREVETDIPGTDKMDYSSMDAFLQTLDNAERPLLKARNKIGKDVFEAYLAQATDGGKKGAPNTGKKTSSLNPGDSA